MASISFSRSAKAVDGDGRELGGAQGGCVCGSGAVRTVNEVVTQQLEHLLLRWPHEAYGRGLQVAQISDVVLQGSQLHRLSSKGARGGGGGGSCGATMTSP